MLFGMMPVGEPQSRFGRIAEKVRKCVPMPAIKPGSIGHPVRNLASILPESSQLPEFLCVLY